MYLTNNSIAMYLPIQNVQNVHTWCVQSSVKPWRDSNRWSSVPRKNGCCCHCHIDVQPHRWSHIFVVGPRVRINKRQEFRQSKKTVELLQLQMCGVVQSKIWLLSESMRGKNFDRAKEKKLLSRYSCRYCSVKNFSLISINERQEFRQSK
jgi:hypothetical protein